MCSFEQNRVSRCFIEGGGTKTKEHWSPWSVYQDGITILPGYGEI